MKNLNLPAKFTIVYLQIFVILWLLSVFFPEIPVKMGERPIKEFLIILSGIEIICLSFLVVRGRRKNNSKRK